MFLTQPPYCSASPEVIEALCAFDIGALVKSAITGENAFRGKNVGDLLKGGEFVGDQVNSVAEKGHISIVNDVRKVVGFTLDKLGFNASICCCHTLFGPA